MLLCSLTMNIYHMYVLEIRSVWILMFMSSCHMQPKMDPMLYALMAHNYLYFEYIRDDLEYYESISGPTDNMHIINYANIFVTYWGQIVISDIMLFRSLSHLYILAQNWHRFCLARQWWAKSQVIRPTASASVCRAMEQAHRNLYSVPVWVGGLWLIRFRMW